MKKKSKNKIKLTALIKTGVLTIICILIIMMITKAWRQAHNFFFNTLMFNKFAYIYIYIYIYIYMFCFVSLMNARLEDTNFKGSNLI